MTVGGFDAVRLRVLVADDDADTVNSLVIVLRLWGHDARAAYGGHDAWRQTTHFRPNVVLLDVAMPEIGGCEVARRIRTDGRFAETEVIAVTGYVDDTHRNLCRHAGFDGFLGKPLELDVLEVLLASAQSRGRFAGAAATAPARGGHALRTVGVSRPASPFAESPKIAFDF